MTDPARRFGSDEVVVGDWAWGIGAWWPHPVIRVNRHSITVGIHRDRGVWLTTQVLPWADIRGVIPAEVNRSPELTDLLDAAAHRLRRGYLFDEQRDALAALLLIAANFTLPTPVTAALHNAITALSDPGEPTQP